MAIFRLDRKIVFPDPHLAEKDGLLAVGGDLSPERIITAYINGIFPWYSEGDPILWWAPDPRFVLMPEHFHISKSLAKVMRKKPFSITFNHAFDQVIESCAAIEREGQPGTWITEEMKSGYKRLHRLGYAISVEAWHGTELAGGLYGITIGSLFFGESMFSLMENSSKCAFAAFVSQAVQHGLSLIDCQVYTPYLESFGARHIPLDDFLSMLHNGVQQTSFVPMLSSD